MFHPIKHFKTISRHRWLVMQHCVKAGIPLQGLVHDLSKYGPTEFIPGARYYLGDKSPNVAEREKKGASLAWMHHMDATSIILSTGSIIRSRSAVLVRCGCRRAISSKCFVTV